MKPSTIILANIAKKGGTKDDAITAIIDYLDEEYEKNLTPEQRQMREVN